MPATSPFDVRGLFSDFEAIGLEPTADPLAFPGYSDQLRTAAGGGESVTAGIGQIGPHKVAAAIFNFNFLGGSMGMRAGDALEEAMFLAAREHVPFIAITATGGARMQEGMAALAQMPRTVAAAR
ncbi:MAG TPA: carboxyl transferase domain-containing protein, partial [Actinomycetota bacterium]|nr:carboxyl transferase domain-containing protein [Actinomycetota bacterium]